MPTDNKIWYFEVESEGNGGHSSSVQNEIATGEWQQLTWRVMNPTGPYKSPSGRGRHHFHDDTPRFSIQMHDGENHTGYINVAASFYVGWQEVVGGFGDAFKTDFWRQGEIAISIVDASDVEQYYIDFRALNVPQLGGAKRIVLCDDKTLYTAEFGNEKPESQIIEVKDYLPNLFLDHTQGWKIKLKRNAEYDYITRTHLAIVEPEHIYDVVTINSMTIPSPDVDLTYGLYNNTYDSKYPDNYTYGYGRFVGTLRSEGDGHFGVNAYPCPGEGSLGEREAVMVDLGEIAPLYLDGQLLTSDDIIHIKDASITYGAQGVIAIGTEMIAFNQNSQDTLSGWNIDNNQKTGCARGYNGTTPSTHEQNDPVYPCLQDAFGNWYIQQYPNIVAIGWARPEGHSYPERYKIIYSYTHNDTP